VIIQSLFNRVSLFECRVELGETIGQESLSVRDAILWVYAELLGNFEGQTLHEECGTDRVGHLLVNFEIQLDGSENPRS